MSEEKEKVKLKKTSKDSRKKSSKKKKDDNSADLNIKGSSC